MASGAHTFGRMSCARISPRELDLLKGGDGSAVSLLATCSSVYLHPCPIPVNRYKRGCLHDAPAEVGLVHAVRDRSQQRRRHAHHHLGVGRVVAVLLVVILHEVRLAIIRQLHPIAG